MESQLESYTNTEISGGGSSDAESHVLELKLKALILDTIHSIDVVQQLIKHGIKSLDEWMWQKQLRYYMQKRNVPYLYSRFRIRTGFQWRFTVEPRSLEPSFFDPPVSSNQTLFPSLQSNTVLSPDFLNYTIFEPIFVSLGGLKNRILLYVICI